MTSLLQIYPDRLAVRSTHKVERVLGNPYFWKISEKICQLISDRGIIYAYRK